MCDHDEVSYGRCKQCRMRVSVWEAGTPMDSGIKWFRVNLDGTTSKPLSEDDKAIHRAITFCANHSDRLGSAQYVGEE